VILPKANEKDLADLPENVRNEMSFVFAETIDEVLKASLSRMPAVGKTEVNLRSR
jgi:ATP-dependent Lon protease